jgi:hypothetical protein
MTTRDTRKDEVYFEKEWKQVNHALNNALSFEEALTSRPQEVNARAILYDIYLSYYKLFYCGYPYGLSLAELKGYAEKTIEYLNKTWKAGLYEDTQWCLQFSILFDFIPVPLKSIIQKIRDNNYQDKYLDYLIRYITSENSNITEKIQFKDMKPLVEVIELAQTDKESAVTRLKKYVDKQWFKTLKEGVITNRALEKEMLYLGFWCFEAAALVKMLELDDSILKDSEYYPWDIVHPK